MLRLLFLCLPWGLSGGTAVSMGAAECPCLSTTSPQAAQAAQALVAAGRTSDYGFGGCKEHDLGYEKSGCKSPSHHNSEDQHCFHKWCWVDPELCSVNTSECKRIGSADSPACRDRPKFKNNEGVGEPLLFYSYHTCDNLDVWTFGTPQARFPEMVGRTLVVTPQYQKAVTFKDLDGQWTGANYELVKLAVRSWKGTSLQIADPPLSDESLEFINGSRYTTCVHDVAIGRLDLCIYPMWITPERLQMVQFLPALVDDPMNFLVQSSQAEEGMTLDDLARPFLPFTAWLWALVLAFLLFSGLSLLCAEYKYNEDDFPPYESAWRKFCRSLYYGLLAFCSGGPAHSPATWPARMITLGLSFFVLIGVATYTANLTSFLVSSSSTTVVKDFEEAIAKNLRICVNEVVEPQLRNTYKKLAKDQLYVPLYEDDCPQLFARGLVDGIILGGEATDKMYTGAFVEQDCQEGSSFLNDPRVCPRDKNGELDLKRDCHLVIVGDPPLQIRMSNPVSQKLHRSLSWAIAKNIENGRYKSLSDQFYHANWPALNVCPKEVSKESKPLPPKSISGTALVSCSLVAIGLIWAVLKIVGVCPQHKPPPAEEPVEIVEVPDDTSACRDAKVAV